MTSLSADVAVGNMAWSQDGKLLLSPNTSTPGDTHYMRPTTCAAPLQTRHRIASWPGEVSKSNRAHALRPSAMMGPTCCREGGFRHSGLSSKRPKTAHQPLKGLVFDSSTTEANLAENLAADPNHFSEMEGALDEVKSLGSLAADVHIVQ